MPIRTVTDQNEPTLADEVVEASISCLRAPARPSRCDCPRRRRAARRRHQRRDPDACADDWVPAAELKAKVRARVSVGDSTLSARLTNLVVRLAIQRRGSTHTTAYRALGLV